MINHVVNSLANPLPLFLIPIKDFSATKTRMRAMVPLHDVQYIEKLAETTFLNIIQVLQESMLSFGVISPSIKIISHSKDLGAKFAYRDIGEGLNHALNETFKKNPLQIPIVIMMADLPFITGDFLSNFLHSIEKNDVLIIPSISADDTKVGTAILYLRTPTLLKFQFGHNSWYKFRDEAIFKSLKVQVLHQDPFARDLDTLNDLKYLKHHLEMVHHPKQFIELLEQLC